MMKYRASGSQMGINTRKRSLMWHLQKTGRCVCGWGVKICVYAGGAECPLLSKQQRRHHLLSDWCGRWRFYLIQEPDSKTGAMLLILLFLSCLHCTQCLKAATGGQCRATKCAAAEQKQMTEQRGGEGG